METIKKSLSIQAVYSQLKESLRGTQSFLLGTPGSISIKKVDRSGNSYAYRSYLLGRKKREDFLCNAGHADQLQEAKDRIEDARRLAQEVKTLRTLDFQVLDKSTGNVLAALYNHGLLGHHSGTLTVAGTLAYCALINELGITAIPARALDVGLSYDSRVKLLSSKTFEEIIKEADDRFFAVPGMPSHLPSTSMKLRGDEAILVDVLTSGPVLAQTKADAGLGFHAQAHPYLDFLMENTIDAMVLAGFHAIPCKVPSPEAFVLHKFYSSSHPNRLRDKQEKDLSQANTLYNHLMSEDEGAFDLILEKAPRPLVDLFKRITGA